MIQLKSASEVIKDFECGNRYDLYVFDVKARNLNLDLVKFIRDSQNITPIMLFLLDVSVPSVFKKIYYVMGVTLSSIHFALKSFYFMFLGFARCF